MRVSLRDAIAAKQGNPRSEWHIGTSSHVTTNPDHAAARIYSNYSSVTPLYSGPKLRHDDAVFAMGSCFAREIEQALRFRGGNVTSIDFDLLSRPEFQDERGKARTSFFHRFTPRALWHEFMIGFDRLDGWDPTASLLFPFGRKTVDLNYWNVEGSDMSMEATLVRRQVAGELVRRAAKAKVIILTLGLTEGWIHKPTGFHINRFVPQVARNSDDFEFAVQDFDDVVKSLNQIHKLLRKVHETGDFQIVVTVSPVPLQITFSGNDIVVANMDSKATLRAAAAAFVKRHENVHYFPSYEMVVYSHTKLAWRPDRLHVNKGMVGKIVSQFIDSYYQPGAEGTDSLAPPVPLRAAPPTRKAS
jgi:hypothetical protein